jgi:NAD(P)-dependent dehydrogenase (short-subunit alcohol dehydrogenase family)
MGRTYAVTGVASGIGAALARCLADQGHKVIGFDLREPQVPVDQFISVDLGDADSIRQAAAQVTTKLDGLCNNAGIPPRDGWEEAILQVNFLGQRAFTQQMLPHLVPGGSIVNMASRAGHGWRDNMEQVKRLAAVQDAADLRAFVQAEGLDPTRAYNLSKEAMILWTLSEAEPMLARGLRINSLSPGGIETAILDDFRRVFGDAMARNVARAGRPGLPEEVAEVAAFVLSPQASWLKGIDIPIDGGMGAFNATDQLGLAALRLPKEV